MRQSVRYKKQALVVTLTFLGLLLILLFSLMYNGQSTAGSDVRSSIFAADTSGIRNGRTDYQPEPKNQPSPIQMPTPSTLVDFVFSFFRNFRPTVMVSPDSHFTHVYLAYKAGQNQLI